MTNKILCLGNEFIKEDSLAKEISKILSLIYKITNINTTYELLDEIKEARENNRTLIILDVVQNLKDVKKLTVSDLKRSNIMTAHDFDASFLLQLMNPKNVIIIGIPQKIQKNKLSELIEKIKKYL